MHPALAQVKALQQGAWREGRELKVADATRVVFLSLLVFEITGRVAQVGAAFEVQAPEGSEVREVRGVVGSAGIGSQGEAFQCPQGAERGDILDAEAAFGEFELAQPGEARQGLEILEPPAAAEVQARQLRHGGEGGQEAALCVDL